MPHALSHSPGHSKSLLLHLFIAVKKKMSELKIDFYQLLKIILVVSLLIR